MMILAFRNCPSAICQRRDTQVTLIVPQTSFGRGFIAALSVLGDVDYIKAIPSSETRANQSYSEQTCLFYMISKCFIHKAIRT